MEYKYLLSLIQGFLTTGGLIIAIGPQNTFVLKQGLLKNHVSITILICCVIDIILITLATYGLGGLLTSNDLLLSIAKWGGAIFLFIYGFKCFQASLKNAKLVVDLDNHKRPNLKKTIIICLALGLLNPHAYVDIFVILGSISAQLPNDERSFFGIGAILMSIFWFLTVGYGARLLIPLFKKPITWKILDFSIGIIMWSIATSLLTYF